MTLPSRARRVTALLPNAAFPREFSLAPRALWRAFRRAPWSFWFLCIYVVFEYLHPQIIYPWLNRIPWGQATMAACLVALLIEGLPSRRWQLMDTLVVAFFAWVFVSCAMAWRPEYSWKDWPLLATWVGLYFLLTFTLTTPRKTFLFWIVFLIINLKMSQHGARIFVGRGFSFAKWGDTGSPVWFENSGEFAMEMAGIVGLSWCFLAGVRRHLKPWGARFWIIVLPGTAFLSVIGSSSRGGQLALGGVLFLLMIFQRVRIQTFILVGLALLLGWFLVPPQQKARFTTMGDDPTSIARLTNWRIAWSITKERPIFGLGFRNWIPYDEQLTASTDVVRIHNSTLQASCELGFPGVALFLLLVATSFVTNARTRRRARYIGVWADPVIGMSMGLDAAMVGFFIAAQFMSVLFYPMFWMSFGLTTALAEAIRREETPLARRRSGPFARGRGSKEMAAAGRRQRHPVAAARQPLSRPIIFRR